LRKYNVEDNEKNMDRNKKLENYNSHFCRIASEVNNLIKTNNYNYNTIQFYGIIFCYFNYYDYNNFLIHFNNLYEENREALYEILLIYHNLCIYLVHTYIQSRLKMDSTEQF